MLNPPLPLRLKKSMNEFIMGYSGFMNFPRAVALLGDGVDRVIQGT